MCEVCYDPLNLDVPEELQDKVYRPGVDGIIPDVDVEMPDRAPQSYSGGSWELIDPEGNAHTLEEVKDEYAKDEISLDQLESETEEILRTDEE